MLLGHELFTAVEYFFFAFLVNPPQSLRDSSPFGKGGAKGVIENPFGKGGAELALPFCKGESGAERRMGILRVIKKRPYPRARSAAVSPPQSLRDSSPFGKGGAESTAKKSTSISMIDVQILAEFTENNKFTTKK